MRIFARPQHLYPSPVAPGGLDAHVAILPLAQLCDQLHASERGLTQAEAQERLLASGPNEPVAHRRGNGIRHMLAFATNPLVVILLLASLVSGLLHDVANATIIALMVLLSVILNAVQTYRSQQAAERYVWTAFRITLRSTMRAMIVALATSWRRPETRLARRRITTSGLVAKASMCRMPLPRRCATGSLGPLTSRRSCASAEVKPCSAAWSWPQSWARGSMATCTSSPPGATGEG